MRVLRVDGVHRPLTLPNSPLLTAGGIKYVSFLLDESIRDPSSKSSDVVPYLNADT